MARRARRGESSSGGRTAGGGFVAGAKVEVRSDDEGFRGAWYEATVVRSLARRRCSVEYVSLVSDADPSEPLREIVRRSHVRPQPPPPPSPARYQLFQRVEAFHNDGWWAGVVSKLHGEDSSSFTVCFPNTREVMDFPPSEIRPLLEWVRGQWIVARDQEVAEPLFSVGAQVEVSWERENYGAAWFAATIVSMISKSIFLVDCKTLRAVTDRELSTEIVDAQYIRPAPPLASEDEDFGLHDVVEVLYHGGWSLGVVTQISNGSKYIVKLKHHEEEMEFNCFEMRSCQVWKDGQWISYSSQVKNRKSPMLGGASSAGPRRQLHVGKRSSLPISVSTSSDDDDVTCVPLSGVLKRMKTEGSGTGGWMRSSQPCRKLKEVKLFDYKLHSQDRFSSKTPLGVEAESHVAKLLLEDSLSSLDVQHCLESTSPEKTATKLPRNRSSMELNYGQNTTEMNGLIKSLTGRNEPSDFMYKGSEHQSKASGFNHSLVNDEASKLLSIMEWGSCKGSRGPRGSSMKRIKKLAIRAPHRQKKSPESMKQYSQEEIKKRKRGRPAKKSIESEQAEDLPEQVAEEEHGRQEIEQSNQGQSCDASFETRAHSHHDEATGYEDLPLLAITQDSPTSNAVSICQTDQQIEVLEDRQTKPQIELASRADTSIKVPTTQQSSFMLGSSFRTRLEEILTFDAQHNNTATGAEEGALVSVSKKDNAASCEGLNPSESPSKRTSGENKEALIDPSSSHSSLKEVILPFLKSSSMWESIKAMDIFHIMPQQPHFRPLEQYSMEFREGMAIGLMVSFANLATSINKLNIADNRSTFEERLKALGPLEANGFDVGRLRACLEELLETQSNQWQSKSKIAELEQKIIERKGDNDRLGALAVQLDKAIMEVEQNLTHFRESRELVIMQRKIIDTEILKLQKDVQEAEEAYRSAERHFNSTAVAPW
ncbi:uncharacterized protein LOC103712141 [Phoenix dactylifera]|uniref:Uncharacterized protein LOC103712141 n=1 Tax=Phoenix dactylifera TaxID=42345 RepID=A0A8B7CDF1_PHODC|nr:uncharacterized protein LOC103712141 [Phoenix dactylifera]